MGLCYNIVFIFSFEYMYPEESNISAICEIITNKEEKEYYNKYIARVNKAEFFIEDSIKELYICGDSRFIEKFKSKIVKILYKDKNNLRDIKNTKIILYVPKEENFSVGDVISIKGKFEKGEVARNYKGFSYRNYLKQKKIYGIVKAKDMVKKGHKINSYSIIENIKYDMKNKIEYLYKDEYANFLKGILLGDTSTLDKAVKETFRDSSISHILAISGLHITYVILGANFLLEKIIKSKKIRNYILIFLLFIFLILTGFSASCIRACIMTSMLLISFNVQRKNNFYVSLGLAFFIIIIINPFNIFNIGMWFSFFGTLGIFLFSKFFDRIIDEKLKFKQRNKVFNKELHKMKKIKLNPILININKKTFERYNIKYNLIFNIINYQKKRLLRNILNSFLVSLSVQILIFPILIYTFNIFSLTFFIPNILISFFIGPILILGYITILVSYIFLPISKFISIIQSNLISIVFKLTDICTNLPFSKIYVTTPYFIEVVIYYLLIFYIVYLVRKRKFYMIKIFLSYKFLKNELYKFITNIKEKMYLDKKIQLKNNCIYEIKKVIYRKKGQKQLLNLKVKNYLSREYLINVNLDNLIKRMLIILISILIIINFINWDLNLKIYFVDVGQGDCTVITTPKKKNIIIDGGEGNSNKYNVGENVVLPYLLDRKIKKIDYLIISHRR